MCHKEKIGILAFYHRMNMLKFKLLRRVNSFRQLSCLQQYVIATVLQSLKVDDDKGMCVDRVGIYQGFLGDLPFP